MHSADTPRAGLSREAMSIAVRSTRDTHRSIVPATATPASVGPGAYGGDVRNRAAAPSYGKKAVPCEYEPFERYDRDMKSEIRGHALVR